jgi:phenylpropionate dioxygenase-like ring-hydroxylating dioxygenase large terminal subunit
VHRAFRALWHPVAWSTEVTESMMPVTLLGEPLIVLRDDAGIVHALADECPHRGAPLSMGSRDGDELVCPFHGWRFGLDGVATCISSLGSDAQVPSRARLGRPAEVTERYGIVWVALEPPRAAILDFPAADDSSLGQFSPTAHVSVVLAGYQTDNLLDASHFPFLHSSLTSRNHAIERYGVIAEHEFGFTTRVPYRLAPAAGSTAEMPLEGFLHYSMTLPFTVLLQNLKPDGSHRRSYFQAIQPIDERHTRLFFIVRGPETDPVELAEMCAVEEEVQREDLWMTAAQRRSSLSLVDGVDLHVRADKNGIMYRRLMKRLIAPETDAVVDPSEEQ